ncbi:MAG: quinoprotein dehydrogenase-associated SoxYZ-like carrier, partial [Candidatus Competibacteraceae bacterium]|nr:quinoprotein dehydrogenase-associated SoxYZ-like carrier [Candidatus Competibacteraceae bacterium]
QTEERYIKTVTVLIDNNPSPFAGRFMFTPKSGNANLFLRVRVNDYTAIRAIAETNDGELFMSKRFVKASGGCSAPPPPDMEKALERMGKMTFRTRTEAPVEPIAAMLNIRHPNTTGMQFYHVTQEFIPAHYVQTVNITFNGEYVMTAETGFSMSEDPSLGFYFVPDRDGELRAEITDSEGLSFTKVHKLKVVQD